MICEAIFCHKILNTHDISEKAFFIVIVATFFIVNIVTYVTTYKRNICRDNMLIINFAIFFSRLGYDETLIDFVSTAASYFVKAEHG